ncbi:MAG: acyltransferase, partial [Rhodospirillaceae bacterium]|nr:acyltransferase [Rhodospirillaceae bacterium]
MAVIKAGLIQMSLKGEVESDLPETIKKKMLDAHMVLIEDAARQGVQVLGL